MLNRIILIGRLTADPELRYLQDGTGVANFTLAVDRGYQNKSGEKEADFIRIVVWRKLAEVVANNLGKGRLVAVEGRLQVRNYDDKEGNRRSISEVVADNVRFLDWPKDGQAQQAPPQQQQQPQQQPWEQGFGGFNNEELPF